MSDVEKYISFIQETELLKNVLRTSWGSSGRQESTAEHSWRLALLAGVMLEEFPELDKHKVLMMCLLHDLGEMYEGDISAATLPDSQKKYEEEYRAVKKIFSLLPPELEEKYMSLWQQYEHAQTPEALFVKALDKAETILQHNRGDNPEDFDYSFNLEYGKEYFKGNPIFIQLREKLDKETREKINSDQSMRYAYLMEEMKASDEATLRGYYEDQIAKSQEEGIKQGEERFGQLCIKMLADNRQAELEKAAADGYYRQRLFEEYNL